MSVQKVDEFEAYQAYMALSLHFKGNYDYFKYNGRVKSANVANWNKRKDRYQFYKLSKKPDPLGFLVANFSRHGTDTWLGKMLSEDKYETTYNKWRSQKQAIEYKFIEELDYLDEDNFKSNINVPTNSNHPRALRGILSGAISPESAIILDACIGCFDYWDEKLKDDIIWPDLSFKLRKYKPFVKYNLSKCREKMVYKFS